MSDHAVTIVVVPRERFSSSIESLESVYQNTDTPFKLVYVDGNSPAKVANWLQEQSVLRGFELVRTEHYLTPNKARNLGLAKVDSKYVVFIDNDLFVYPGWLSRMIECAEQTNAALVTPMLLEGDGDDRIIHMAGGVAKVETRDGANYASEVHRWPRRRLDDMQWQLKREKTELIEFHCVLSRADVLAQLGPFDPELMSMAEHTDFSLLVLRAGYTIYIEPSALVTYHYAGPYRWSDLPYFYMRWSDRWTSQTVNHFRLKWSLSQDDKYLKDIWGFVRHHRGIVTLDMTGISRLFGAKFASIAERELLRIYRRLVSTIVYSKARASTKTDTSTSTDTSTATGTALR